MLGFAQGNRDILFLGLDNAGKRVRNGLAMAMLNCLINSTVKTLLHMLAHDKLVSLPPTVYPCPSL
jgi:S-methylmethionine-dependent homocysteine/selenocysteine methylase